ncbi:MAG: hypothetical protein JWR19_2462 [Pedosphaera sp.]|nr:hypothetical protein [Pedosphaera sp.]
MNCENFNDRLPEYLDETLSTTEQAAAREHVQKCGACQQAVARQEALAKSIRLSFNRETQGLSLSAETRQNILNALKQPSLQPTSWERLRACCAVLWLKPVRVGLVLLCLLLLISGSRFHRQRAERSTLPATAQAASDIYVIDVPIETEMHFYRRQNNRVVDAVVTGVSVIDASFSGNLSPATSLKRHIH